MLRSSRSDCTKNGANKLYAYILIMSIVDKDEPGDTHVCLAFLPSRCQMAVFAQEAPAQAKAAKETREGTVIRSSPDNSTLIVRKRGSSAEMTVQYDSSTRWVSQEHGSKKVNDIDASQVKDGDRVISKGTGRRVSSTPL